MQQEIEATFLEADHALLRRKLEKLGAVCEHPVQDMKRVVYDYPDMRLDKMAAWIRIRQEAGKVTMCYKRRDAETIDGMQEIEFSISDYAAACAFLEAIGLQVKASQETKRETWRLGDCEIMLDEWPWVPPYVEIEAATEATIREVAAKLGLEYGQAVFDSADGVYQKYFDVTRTEISTVPIEFGPIPDWLEAKRR